MFATYDAQETAARIGIDRHSLPLMRELGILKGIKTGRGWRYSDEELAAFWEEYLGEDLSNEELFRMTALIHRKKAAGR